MGKKLVVTVSIVTMLSLLMGCAPIAGSELTLGVKKGDWIEYHTVITGTPVPEHNVSRARIEILDVQGFNVTTQLTSWLYNGTVQTIVEVLNPQEGKLGSWFLIGANLNTGDTFYDKNAPNGGGTYTIQGVNELTYAGATRAISFCPSYFEAFKRWDKATGIFVEGFGIYRNYSLNTVADKTNMWNPEVIELDQTLFYGLVAIVVVLAVVAVAALILAFRRKR